MSYLRATEVSNLKEEKEKEYQEAFKILEHKKEERLKKVLKGMQKDYEGFLNTRKEKEVRNKSVQREEGIGYEQKVQLIQDRMRRADEQRLEKQHELEKE